MDKNIGEQLNKAYEAFRQACMDRDYAVKEMQQKVRVRFLSFFLSPVDNYSTHRLKFNFRDHFQCLLLQLEMALNKPNH